MKTQAAVMCNHCSDALYTHGDVCTCKNLAILFDADDTLRLYVEDIRTARRVLLYLHDNQEISRDLLRPFNFEVFADYSYIANNSLTFQPHAPDNSYVRKTSTKYNDKLINALDLYKNTTSDGVEVFLPTSLTDPKRLT